MKALLGSDQIPALDRRVEGRRLIFADNAATSLKHVAAIDAAHYFSTQICANVHRGIHLLSEEADRLFESARRSVARLIGADADEIIFVRNTTEAINLAAQMVPWQCGDEVVASVVDHHSNLLPWAARASLRLATPHVDGTLEPESFARVVGPRTRLVAIGHVSNVTGLISPARAISAMARRHGALILIDGAQSAGHLRVDVKALDCDFFAFSGHKMLGPSGIGVLYARREILEQAPCLLHGGGMVTRVGEDGSLREPAPIPHRFEAGTPNIEGALGLGAACEALMDLGPDRVEQHGRALARALIHELSTVPHLRLAPETLENRLPIVCFRIEGLDSDRVAMLLSQRFGILARSGVHCAEPLAHHWGVEGWCRISLYLYNDLAEVIRIREALETLSSLVQPVRPGWRRFGFSASA